MTRRSAHPDDPRALIAEAYAIEGLAEEEARAIFFDWALGAPAEGTAEAAARLLDHHAGAPAGHPMTALLRQASGGPARPARRSGRRGRGAG